MPLRNLTLAKKGLLIIIVPLIYQAVLLGMLLERNREQAAAETWVVHTEDLLSQLDRLQVLILRVQDSARGYLLTQNSVFLEETEGERKQLEAALDRFGEFAQATSIEQRVRAERIGAIIQDRLAANKRVLEKAKAGDWEGALAPVRALKGKEAMDRLSAEIGGFQALAEQYDEQRLNQLRHSTNAQDRLLIGGLVLNGILGIGSAMLFGRSLAHRLCKLGANAQRFSRGEPLGPAQGGSDELGDLDQSFHEMAETLSRSQQSERAAQHTLQRRNRELERVNRELDDKNRENEMFVYSVSHDLRSPLVNLQGFSKELGLVREDLQELLQQEWTEKVKERALSLVATEVPESIHYIQTAVMRLSAIVDALLRLSRAGRVDYEPEMVDLQAVVQRIATSLRSSAAERRATFEIATLPSAWGDPTALEQIFANLLANAVNYLDPARPGRIEVGYCHTLPPGGDGLPTYYVKDNGLGIAEAYLPKVFAIFQRLHAQAAQGEGVGLTLVRRMIERHGGHIWVHSREGEGSTFFLSLPPRDQSPLPVAPRKESIRLSMPAETTSS